MRRMVLVAALGVVAQPAAACAAPTPYRPLTARPAGTQSVLLVEVVSLDFARYPAVATVSVIRDGKRAATTHRISFQRSICGGERDPAKGDRLVVYLRGSDALGWAIPAEAKRLERSFG
ncbi:hypothetical protein [Sphingomonas sp. Leaf4]|uniref:hypothetical protein n=1 Tax=Sphingomonas sp. Leaf4 TaxID=2876553 RepID=UPI001E5C334F|nr:hypothetical protein [Sphingomonas sp. Leaf4]